MQKRRIPESVGFDIAIPRTTVVFLHAFPMNRWMWQPQIAYLTASGVPTVVVDYPGFGATPPFNFPPTMTDYAQYIRAILDELRIPKAVFVGLSMGGYVAFALYRILPERFAGLVLANTRASADTEETRKRRMQMIADVRRARSPEPVIAAHLDRFLTASTRQTRPQLVETVRDLMQRASPMGIIQALWAMADRPDATPLLEEFPFPVLVIAGAQDPLTPPDAMREMAHRIRDAEFVSIADAAHLSNMEQPDAFNDALLRYLQRIGW